MSFIFLLFSVLFKNFKTKYKIIPPPVPANPFNMPEVIDETDNIILFLLNIFFIFPAPLNLCQVLLFAGVGI